jgi:hypothetical protein
MREERTGQGSREHASERVSGKGKEWAGLQDTCWYWRRKESDMGRACVGDIATNLVVQRTTTIKLSELEFKLNVPFKNLLCGALSQRSAQHLVHVMKGRQ